METYDFKNEIIDNNGNKINILDVYNFNKIKENYINSLKTNNYSQNTIKTYSSIIQKFTNYLKQQIAIYNEKEFVNYFNKYINDLKIVKNVSQNYIYLVTVVVKKFLEFNNIHFLDSIIIPKRTKSIPNFLTESEVKILLNSITWDENSDSNFRIITKLRDKLIVTLLYSSGLRVSELINLKINDINFNEKKMTVKGKDNNRIILLNKSSILLLKKYLQKRTQQSEYLFVNKSGNQLTSRYVQLMIKKYGEESKLDKKITPHVLRHSYATNLLKQGVNIKIIQQLLGHTNISTTQIYTQYETIHFQNFQQIIK
ncbi:site-specific tyrosine recombinase/integron integrase [uncultured Methanobrevibacter sp.]|uniref:site-specific tyrosine recombinase/integron integrase n=1 Tax=uncultured Methanobrevibacter sp. TaxID=253161 RepID=UPI002639F593|nr:site-specific tyrosine recombinase/integron integrase [uncultured Methanobrevibacter sp.]